MNKYKEKNGVYQTKSGLWGISYRDNDGKKCREVCAATRSEAIIQRAKKIMELCSLKHNPALVNNNKRMKDFTEVFIREHISRLGSERSSLSMFKDVNDFFKDYRLKDITPNLVNQYYEEKAKKTSYSTANRSVGLLSKFFNFLINGNKFSGPNPCQKVKKHAENSFQPNPLTQQEIMALMDHLADYIKPCVAFALYTGLRRQELLGLRWEHINFHDNYINIPKTKTATPRVLGLTSDMKAILEHVGMQKSGLVFHISKSQLRYQLTHAAKKANLDHVRVHDLRHTYCKNFLDRGGNLIYLQKFMGHKNIKTTMKYLKYKGNQVAEKMAIMNGLLPSFSSVKRLDS